MLRPLSTCSRPTTGMLFSDWQAVTQALQYHCPHADGVELCLRQLLQPDVPTPQLDLHEHPRLQGIAPQPVSLAHYNQLLPGGGQNECQLAA